MTLSSWCIRVLVLPTVMILAMGCQPKESSDGASNLKWGHLSSPSFSMASLLPNNSISVCGFKAKETANHIRSWASIIGRDKGLDINGDCTNQVTRKIQVFDVSEKQDRICKGFGAAGYTDMHDIYLCNRYSEAVESHILLHEVGHLWGMCDQYGDAAGCDPQNKGIQDPSSVMGAASGLTALTRDDIIGIKALAQRRDISANARWNQFLKDADDNNPAPDTPDTDPGEPPLDGGTGELCGCRLSGSTCSVVESNGKAFAWIDGVSEVTCKNYCESTGILFPYRQQCQAQAKKPTDSEPTPPGDTPADDDPLTERKQWCESTGARWDTLNADGFARCDCRNMIFRDDAIKLLGKVRFQERCRSYL